MSEWQPISTAPKDGTTILAYCVWADGKDEYGQITIVWMDHRGGYWGLAGCSSLQIDSFADPSDQLEPTHWQPLPSPPTNLMGGK